MTTTSIPIHYPTATDRLIARLGRALVAWADNRAAFTHERQFVARGNEHDRFDRERAAATSLSLRA